RAYGLLAEEAAALARLGCGVVLDGTAHRKAWRDAARAKVAHFAEVHVACPLDTAMQREAARPQGHVMAGLYAKALERRRTGRECPGLGQVIGVDVPFEEDPAAECRVDNAGPDPVPAAGAALDCLRAWLAREGLT
ncbi:MAG: adenylyl-sulfate kinase, partial [Desulfovibrionaceae bacterium]